MKNETKSWIHGERKCAWKTKPRFSTQHQVNKDRRKSKPGITSN